MDGLNKMCVFSAVIKPASGNIIRRGGVMETEISKQDAIKYLERKSFPGWDACSDKPAVSLSDVEYLIDLIYS